jgi:hypothetical protein
MKLHHLISIKLKTTMPIPEVYFTVDEVKFEQKNILYWNKVIDDIQDYAEVSIGDEKTWNEMGIKFGWKIFY